MHSKLKTPNSKLAIGLIGGIGSGKSQVARELVKRGGKLISGDELGHEALRQPEVRDRVVKRFGPGILGTDGEIVRPRLGALVFTDPVELAALEAIVHPWIHARLRKEVDSARNDPAVRFVILDAAVMMEAGWHEVCDKILFVDAPEEVRLQRVAERRGWTAAELHAREARQMPLTDKASRADHGIDNSGSLEHLSRQVDALLHDWDLTAA